MRGGGKGGRVFRRKPGSTKRLCRCPVRPAFPLAIKPPLPPRTASHPDHAALLSSPVHLVLSSSHTRTFIRICYTCKDSPLDYFKPIEPEALFIYRLMAWSLHVSVRQVMCCYNEDKIGYLGTSSKKLKYFL